MTMLAVSVLDHPMQDDSLAIRYAVLIAKEGDLVKPPHAGHTVMVDFDPALSRFPKAEDIAMAVAQLLIEHRPGKEDE